VYGSGREIKHVGVIIAVTELKAYIVLSKWGVHGEYRHTIGDLPASCHKPIGFWTDRKATP